MNKVLLFSVILAFASLLTSCSSRKDETTESTNLLDKPISIKGAQFIDGFGRQILFNGINLVNKNPNENYIGLYADNEIFKNFKKWGFNVVRLGIIWDGIEPEPGVYNEEYLQEIDKQVKMAEENGLFVFLDMHQDLYGVKYGDGAPKWATLDEDKPHVVGSIWSDAYLISPAVQTAWDNFWKNTPASDGVGLQDHYANAWQHVAKRYVGNHTVIGYDLMNEPFVGSEAQMFMPIMFTAFSQLVSEETGEKLSVKEVAAMWANEQTRYEALQMIATKKRFAKVIDEVYELNSAFEKEQLQPFYQKVAGMIREVDKEKILFLNHSYFCNSGLSTSLEPLKTVDGKTDPLVAYAAHVYDLLVDTKKLTDSSTERLELMFERINESGERLNMPVLIGEWGAFGGSTKGLTELAQTQIALFEKYMLNNTYWAYYPGVENDSYFKTLIRPYPAFVAGDLVSYAYNTETGMYTCVWNEKADVKAPTRIFIPNLKAVSQNDIVLKPEVDGNIIEPLADSEGGYLVISRLGKNQIRELSFTIQKEAKDIALSSD